MPKACGLHDTSTVDPGAPKVNASKLRPSQKGSQGPPRTTLDGMDHVSRTHHDPATGNSAARNAATGPETPGASARQQLRVTVRISGTVQGVGFRYWTARQATALGLEGFAANQADGSVEIIAEGPRANLDELLMRLRSGATPGHVEHVETEFSAATGEFPGFSTS